MNSQILYLLLLLSVSACGQSSPAIEGKNVESIPRIDNSGSTVNTRINPPAGYIRLRVEPNSFEAYLRDFTLKPDGEKVLFFNGKPKYNQNIHAAVLDIDVGSRDLQQCADAVMRLRGEYLFHLKSYSDIAFSFVSDGKARYFLEYTDGDTSYKSFRSYMNYIFSYANTRSLHNEMIPVGNFEYMKIGDVFIQTGNPYGHAVIVVDMAENAKTGNKIFMLAQSYMPAQDIHILKNPHNTDLSPWYNLDVETEQITTPEWLFYQKDLRRFK